MKIDSIADNFICMDKERIEGFCAAFEPGVTMASLRAKTAIECIEAMCDGVDCETEIVLPVGLIKRESTEMLACQNS